MNGIEEFIRCRDVDLADQACSGGLSLRRAILMPILIQNVITNFVSMLDNIMVGQIGTEPMSGVAIVNQLVFVFNLCALGGVSGAGILTAQFYGKGDQEGIRQSVRVKLVIGLSILAVLFHAQENTSWHAVQDGSRKGGFSVWRSSEES